MKRKVWGIGSLFGIMILIIAILLMRNTGPAVSNSKLKVAQINLEKVLENHPDWSKYSRLRTELSKLEKNWAAQTGQQSDGLLNPELDQRALQHQTTEMNRIFNEEAELKLTDLNKALAEYVKSRQNQIDSLLKDKVSSLNEQLNKEFKTKSDEVSQKVNFYRSHVLSESQLTLSNLQLQLSTIDLSLNPKESQIQKEQILAQIDQINQENEQKIQAEQKRLRDEYNRFVEQRKADVAGEIAAFKSKLRQDLEDDIRQYRGKLGSDFNEWRQNKIKEMNDAVKSRKGEISEEYTKYTSEKLILEAQMQQIKESVIWDLKNSVKKLARRKKLDLVVTGDLAGLKPFDLTPELKKIMCTGKRF